MNKIRNSRIELLRLISILLIVAYHATRNFGDIFYVGELSEFNLFIRTLFGSWGMFGVYCFVIISAWYNCDKKFNSKKIIKLLFEILVYVLFFIIIDSLVYDKGFEYVYKSFLSQVIELFNGRGLYWFFTAYLIMSLFIPVLNKISNYKNLKKIIILLSFIPVFCNFSQGGGAVGDVMLFMYVYLLTAYIKKNKIEIKNSCLLTIFTIIIVVLMQYFKGSGIHIGNFVDSEIYYIFGNLGRGSIVTMLLSFLVFVGTIYKEPYNNRIINYFSSLSLGVYCFHENAIFNIVNLVFQKSFDNGLINSVNFSYMYIVISIAIVFMGFAFELLRRYIIQNHFDNFVDKHLNTKSIDDWFNSI